MLGAWSSLGITTELLLVRSSSIPGWAGMLHPWLGWDLHAWPGCSVLLTAASPSPSSLLLVLFQCFLLELFEVFWDVCSCKLIDRLG